MGLPLLERRRRAVVILSLVVVSEGAGLRKPMQSRGRVALYKDEGFWAALEREVDLAATPRVAAMLARTRAAVARGEEEEPRLTNGWRPHPRIPGRVARGDATVAAGQCVEVDGHVAGLRAQPVWETRPRWLRALETDVAPAARAEVAALEADLGGSLGAGGLSPWTGAEGTGFKSIRLLESFDVKPTPASALFPETMAALSRAFDGADRGHLGARHVTISCQQPATGIARHTDGANTVLTAHVGLQLGDPAKCGLVVGGGGPPETTLRWREGEAFYYDTSFEHHTFNNAAEPRYILHVDAFHPDRRLGDR